MAIKRGSESKRSSTPAEKAMLRKPNVTHVASAVGSSLLGNTRERDGERKSNARPLEEFPDLADVLPELCAEYRDIQAKLKVLEERRKELSAEIGPLLVAAGHESIRGDGWVATRSCQNRETLKKELLLQNGVSMATITKSTVIVPVYQVSVRGVKDE